MKENNKKKAVIKCRRHAFGRWRPLKKMNEKGDYFADIFIISISLSDVSSVIVGPPPFRL
jgi:hypothetical protein